MRSMPPITLLLQLVCLNMLLPVDTTLHPSERECTSMDMRIHDRMTIDIKRGADTTIHQSAGVCFCFEHVKNMPLMY